MGTLNPKKTMFIFIALVILFLVVVLMAYHVFSTKGLVLVAEETVYIYETQKKAMAWPSQKVIAKLSSGQSVPVAECVDVKHYLIYKVELPDGRNGFVLDGNYSLMRNGKKAFCH